MILKSICKFGPYADAVLASNSLKNLPGSLKKAWEMFINQNALTQDTAETIEILIDLIKLLVARKVEAVAQVGGIETVTYVAHSAAKVLEQESGGGARSKSKLVSSIILSAMNLLDYVSRSMAGVKVFCERQQTTKLLEIINVAPGNTSPSSARPVSTTFQSRRRSMLPKKQEKPNTGSSGASKGYILQYLPIGLRIVDRLCRNDESLGTLKE